MGGQIIAASVLSVPGQRNTRESRAAIKNGWIPQTWKAKPERLRQLDRDAPLVLR